MNKRHSLKLFGLSLGLLVTSFGHTQVLEEIVVTAQKREQGIQDVGSSVTAFSGDQFRELGFENVASVASQTPNLTFGEPAGEGTTATLSIRGVGLNEYSDSAEGAVAVYIDEVYQGTLPALGMSLFDLERVEVLRGPQGTLYGRNTTGGLAHFITRKPTEEFEAFGEVRYASHDQIRFEGAVGGPLGDSIRGRVAYYHNEKDGNQYDRVNQTRGASANIDAVRGQLAIDLSTELNLLVGVHYATADNSPTLYKHRGLLVAPFGPPCSEEAVFARQCFGLFGYQDTSPKARSVEGGFGVYPFLKNDVWGASAKLVWTRDDWEVVSVTAFQNVEKDHLEVTLAIPFLTAQTGFRIDSDQVSQELRISKTSERLHWMLGAYYYNDDKPGSLYNPAVAGVPVPPLPNGLFYHSDYDQETETYAVFGHADWEVIDNLVLKLGLRWTEEQKDLDFSMAQNGFFGPYLPFSLTDKFETDGVSWNVGLNWSVVEDTLLFVNVAEGFKTGGFNSGGFLLTSFELEPYDDETVLMYEAGLKTTQFDGRVRVNATGFFYDYEDFQALTIANVGALDAPVTRLTNAGSVDIHGFELELTLNPVDFFEASFGLGYLDTETQDFVSFVGLDDNGQPIFDDFSGSELTLAPEFTYNGIFRLFGPVLGGEASLQVDFTASDEYFYDADNAPVNVGGDFTIWNARAAWKTPDGRYEIAVFGRNLTDEEYVLEGFSTLGAQSLIYNGNDSAVGVSLSATY